MKNIPIREQQTVAAVAVTRKVPGRQRQAVATGTAAATAETIMKYPPKNHHEHQLGNTPKKMPIPLKTWTYLPETALPHRKYLTATIPKGFKINLLLWGRCFWPPPCRGLYRIQSTCLPRRDEARPLLKPPPA